MKLPEKQIVIKADTTELARQVAAIRLCLSQVGFALDTLLLSITEPARERDEEEA